MIRYAVKNLTRRQFVGNQTGYVTRAEAEREMASLKEIFPRFRYQIEERQS